MCNVSDDLGDHDAGDVERKIRLTMEEIKLITTTTLPMDDSERCTRPRRCFGNARGNRWRVTTGRMCPRLNDQTIGDESLVCFKVSKGVRVRSNETPLPNLVANRGPCFRSTSAERQGALIMSPCHPHLISASEARLAPTDHARQHTRLSQTRGISNSVLTQATEQLRKESTHPCIPQPSHLPRAARRAHPAPSAI